MPSVLYADVDIPQSWTLVVRLLGPLAPLPAVGRAAALGSAALLLLVPTALLLLPAS
ncbi:hypothetical protein [Blastococcus saxobsidens]|uniref:Putative peptidase n=1 Tax=Blastococcus saxobsidens (strain DD2) TaxID=1146883 RepID=H6RMF8_BLASD|nr:hypothetical protein [Blastococcus saxobsidens]CCG02594.1 putative peptidase [Blastococcus saxobsidens DD2]